MPTKKQTKKLTPSKLIKTNGKFDWKKLSLLAIIFIAAGTIVAFTTFASSSVGFYTSTNDFWNRDGYIPFYNYNGTLAWGVHDYRVGGGEYNWWKSPKAVSVSAPSGQTVQFCITMRNEIPISSTHPNMSFYMDMADVGTGKIFTGLQLKYSGNNWGQTCVHGTVPKGTWNTVQYRVYGVLTSSGGAYGNNLLIKQANVTFY